MWKQGIVDSGSGKCSKLYLKVVISTWSRFGSAICVNRAGCSNPPVLWLLASNLTSPSLSFLIYAVVIIITYNNTIHTYITPQSVWHIHGNQDKLNYFKRRWVEMPDKQAAIWVMVPISARKIQKSQRMLCFMYQTSVSVGEVLGQWAFGATWYWA